VAGDNKFSTGDSFKRSLSKRSGKTQLQDQNDMNADQNPGDPDKYKDLSLNAQECDCKPGESQQQEVLVPMISPFGLPMPGINPSWSGKLAPNTSSAPSLPEVKAPGLVPEMVPEGFEVPVLEVP
jgi:hypothetical protein